jgi:rubrerythrin
MTLTLSHVDSREAGMSESTDVTMATRKNFLEVCMGIERLCAELYNFYGDLYEDNPEASRLWKKTALEEENHQNQFGLALRLLDETEFDVPQDSMEHAYSIQYKLLKLLNHIKNVKPELVIAVSKAVEMEQKLADLHVHSSLRFKDISIRNLFKTLSEADRDHVAALQQYQAILYLPQSEMRER